MPRKTIDHLMTQLHDVWGDTEPSPQVQQLMLDMQRQATSGDDAAFRALADSARALATELEADHPQAVAVARKIIETLSGMGI